MFILDRL